MSESAVKSKRIFIIDGANCVFRAFYALPPLSNSKGMPTGALLGFSRILIKLLRENKPDLAAVCFDTPEPTFRDELFAEYKANRKEPPEELVAQFPYTATIAKMLGYHVLEKPGFEADDVIGTLAKKYSEMGYEVVIVSSDKDLMQLVNDKVTLLDEMKGKNIGAKEVEEKFGVGPERVIDVLALMGDSSDNVPGVKGVGPKTASMLIKEYGSLDEVIAHAGELKGAVSQKIISGVDDAILSRKLVTIDRSVPLSEEDLNIELNAPDLLMIKKMFTELEFTKLIEEFAVKEQGEKTEYVSVSGLDELRKVAALLRKEDVFGVDISAESENPMNTKILGIAFSIANGENYFIPILAGESNSQIQPAGQIDCFAPPAAVSNDDVLSWQSVLGEVGDVLASDKIKKVGYDLNYLKTVFLRHGVTLNGFDFDVMLASYSIDPAAEHDYAAIVKRFLGKVINVDSDDGLAVNNVCARSAHMLPLKDALAKRMASDGVTVIFEKIEMPLVDVLVLMQTNGVKVDTRKLKLLHDEFARRLEGLEKNIYELSGGPFNINSPKQLGVILFEKLKLPGGKRTKTGFSTSQEILEELSLTHELPALILEYRSLSKLVGTYIDALPELINSETGRIHTTFNQARTATGRLSSSDPNLQNIPIRSEEGRKIREAFVAEKGFVLLSADYSQIELRVLAHMSGESVLCDAFLNGEDVHAKTASGIFGVSPKDISDGQRSVGKTVNFATIYGQSAFGLSRQLGIEPKEAASYIDGYFRKYPRVLAYKEEVLDQARKNGFVKTLFGRVRYLPDITNSNVQIRQLAERMAFNTVIQGTAADIIKKAMIRIYNALPKISNKTRMLLQVHDELVFEVPINDVEAVKKIVIATMEGIEEISVPLIASAGVGESWAGAH